MVQPGTSLRMGGCTKYVGTIPTWSNFEPKCCWDQSGDSDWQNIL